MSIGSLVRKILGKRIFAVVGRWYRSIFVDLDKVASAVSGPISSNAHIVDIGGGDGEPLNHLFQIRKDLRVTMIDLSPTIGYGLLEEYRRQVTIYPQTSIAEYTAKLYHPFDVIVISDVVHHVPVPMRAQFYTDVRELAKLSPMCTVVIKDTGPEGFIGKLAHISDYYISGDKQVKLIPQDEHIKLVKSIFGDILFYTTDLFHMNPPNYSFYFHPFPEARKQ